jgi:hypothetical protein
MRRRTIVVSGLLGLGLTAVAAAPVAAQTRVAVPIVIHVPRAGVSKATPTSVRVTTATTSHQPGQTTTRVTVQDTTGRLLGVSPTGPTAFAPAPPPPSAGVNATRITVRDTTGRLLGAAPAMGPLSSSTSSVRITVDRGSSPRGAGPAAPRQAVAGEVSGTVGLSGSGGPFTIAAGSGARRTVTITSDAPIDTPIVILGF